MIAQFLKLKRRNTPQILLLTGLVLCLLTFYLLEISKPIEVSIRTVQKLVVDPRAGKYEGKLLVDPFSGPLMEMIDLSDHQNVHRGKSFYYEAPESLHLGSFEAWRPRERIGKRRNAFCNRGKRNKDNIFVVMQTSSTTLWQNVPIQLMTTFQDLCNFEIFSDSADAIGGVEIHDALQHIHAEVIDTHQDFEGYRIAKSIRSSHISVAADHIKLPGIDKLKKFVILPMLYQTYIENPNFDWYVVVDENACLFGHNLREFLSSLDPKEVLYLGNPVQGPELSFADIGSTIVLSHALMKHAFDFSPAEKHTKFDEKFVREVASQVRGDYALALFLQERIGVSLNVDKSRNFFHPAAIYDIQMTADNWCTSLGSLGGQKPRENELLADYLDLKRGQQILHLDLYLDFVKPYLTGLQENWDNSARSIEYSPQHPRNTDAHESLTSCREQCSKIEQCTMFRYDAFLKYCGLGIASVALGNPVLQYSNSPDESDCTEFGIRCSPRNRSETMTSEWFIDRIRSMRKAISCDPLHSDERSEGSEFGALDQVEGWWHRAEQN